MISIALIGAGQIGSRHLQSLARLDRPARVTVVEPSAPARATARERYESARKEVAACRIEELRFLDSVNGIDGGVDVAIVATSADGRRAAIEQLLARARVRYLLLEKVLFQRLADYGAVGTLLEQRGVAAWVNCSQRLWPFFQEARAEYPASGPVELVVSGSNWGLGCNAIHNLDFLPFLTGDPDVTISAQLDGGVVPAKRPGFVEFTGVLVAEDRHGNRVTQTSLRDGDARFDMEIRADDGRVWRFGDSPVPRQSELTRLVVEALLDRGECELPRFGQSAELHLRMLQAFLEHLGGDLEVCPIT